MNKKEKRDYKNIKKDRTFLIFSFIILLITVILLINQVGNLKQENEKLKFGQLVYSFEQQLDYLKTTNCDGTFFVKRDFDRSGIEKWYNFQQVCNSEGYCKYGYTLLKDCEIR